MNFDEILGWFLQTVDITSGFNPGLTIALCLLVMVGEVYLSIPYLVESLYLAIGYQTDINTTALLHTILLLFLAQVSRQVGAISLYYVLRLVNMPLSKFYMKLLENNRFYKKYAANDYLYNAEYLSPFSAVLGMATPLNGPIKVILILKGRLKIMLLGTFVSGVVFDTVYLIMGIVFHTMKLSVGYLPLSILAGLLIFLILSHMLLRRRRRQNSVQ